MRQPSTSSDSAHRRCIDIGLLAFVQCCNPYRAILKFQCLTTPLSSGGRAESREPREARIAAAVCCSDWFGELLQPLLVDPPVTVEPDEIIPHPRPITAVDPGLIPLGVGMLLVRLAERCPDLAGAHPDGDPLPGIRAAERRTRPRGQQEDRDRDQRRDTAPTLWATSGRTTLRGSSRETRIDPPTTRQTNTTAMASTMTGIYSIPGNICTNMRPPAVERADDRARERQWGNVKKIASRAPVEPFVRPTAGVWLRRL